MSRRGPCPECGTKSSRGEERRMCGWWSRMRPCARVMDDGCPEVAACGDTLCRPHRDKAKAAAGRARRVLA